MAQPVTLPSSPSRAEGQTIWILTALASHIAWGMYPVLGRYLQTVSLLPTFSILVLGNAIVLVTLWRYLWRKTPPGTLKNRAVWTFAVIVVLRAITNIASTRYTLSIYVQLIVQTTPFVVILLSTLVLREKLPRFTIPALTLTLFGAMLMLGPSFGDAPAQDSTRQDWLGIGLASLSVVFLAIYMILVRRSVKHAIPGESLLLVQLIGIIGTASVLALISGEDWTQYARLSAGDWAIFLFFSFAVFLGANIGQIQALRHIGAPMVSSVLAIRLVSALIFGAILLNERLESLWQVLGAGVVLVTITWFLWNQRQETGSS